MKYQNSKSKSKNGSNGKSGFAALILVLSISSLLLAFSFMQSIEYGHFFDAVRNKENRLASYYSAYSCIDQALLALVHDYFFLNNKEIEIPELNCAILSVAKTSSSGVANDDIRTIVAYGKYMKTIVYRRATVQIYDNHLEVISIE